MKKIYSFFASLTAVVMLMGIISFLRVNAAAATVLPTDSDAPRSGCTFLGIEGKYIAQIQEALDRINEIRLEACKEGVINPSTGNPLTSADYIPIKWSADLEYIARLRAAEASVTMDHKRLNGESIWGITGPNGVRSYGEVIAWNWSETMTQGIDQWYGEKEDWVKSTPGAVTGHYTQMINPNNRYVGLGTFCSKSVKYYNTTAGEFSGDLKNPDTSRGTSTGNIIQTLEVKNDLISYEISGSDTLSVSAAITTTDYWSKPLKTEGLTIIGASANNVQWSSSNNDIVTVSNGKITVKKCGSAVITAKMPDGSSLTKIFSSQHSYKTTTTAATCKSEGKITETCTVCGDTKTKTIPKTNKHSYKTTTTAATCKSEGKIVKTCTVCGDTDTQTIPKTNQHSYKTTTTAATCKSEGKIVETCTVCGDTNTKTIPKTDQHSFGNWVTTKPPTQSSDGLEKRVCAVCNAEETRTLKYEGSDTSSDENSSSGDSSSSTTSDDNSSLTSSEDNSSSTTSDDNSSSTTSEDNSSSTISDDNSSSISSSGNSSTVSSNGDSSAPLSSDGSSEPSSGDEVQSEAASDSSEVADTSNDTDSGNSNKMLPFLIAGGGVLVAGAIGFVIFLLIKREKKLK